MVIEIRLRHGIRIRVVVSGPGRRVGIAKESRRQVSGGGFRTGSVLHETEYRGRSTVEMAVSCDTPWYTPCDPSAILAAIPAS